MGRSKSGLPGCAPACGTVYRRVAAFCDGQGQKPPAGVRSGLLRHLPTRCAVLRWAGAKATCRGALRPLAPSTDKLRRSAMGRSKSGLPGCASCQRQRLPTGCASLRWAGAKAACRGDLRPAAASADALRRSAMGRSKSHLLGCAPACGTVYRRVAASYDGQEQKRPAGVISGLRQRLPTGCAALRWAGAKATCRGALRPAAPSTDRLRRPTMGAKATRRGDLRPDVPSADALRRPTMGAKATRRGALPASGSVYRPAAPLCDGQEQKRPAGVIFGQRQRLPTRCGVLRWAGAKATCWGALRPAAPSTDALRRPTMGRSKSGLPG